MRGGAGRAVRLDERGGVHILDQKGCRGRMSGICEARRREGAGTDHQPPLMLATRARDFFSFCKIESIADTLRQAQAQAQVQQVPGRRSSVYRANHASERARFTLGKPSRGDRGRMKSKGVRPGKRRAAYAYRTTMVRETAQ